MPSFLYPQRGDAPCGRGESSAAGAARMRPPFSFPRKKTGVARPKERRFPLQASSSKSCNACQLLLPARGVAAVGVAIRFDLLLSSAVAQPLAALLPYGCGTPLAGAALPILQEYAVISVYRQSHQCGERSNAAFGRQSAAELPSLAPHDSKARLIVVTTRRDSWRSHVHRTYIAQRVQLFKLQTANAGGREVLPSPFSGGSKGGILFGKRIPPLSRAPCE